MKRRGIYISGHLELCSKSYPSFCPPQTPWGKPKDDSQAHLLQERADIFIMQLIPEETVSLLPFSFHKGLGVVWLLGFFLLFLGFFFPPSLFLAFFCFMWNE